MFKQAKPYFKHLYKMDLKALGFIYGILLVFDIMQILFKAYIVSIGIDLRVGHRAMLFFVMSLIGNGYGSGEFDGLMSIRGNRKAFLQGCVLAIVSNSIVLGMVDVGAMNLITYIASRPRMHANLYIVYYSLKDIGINMTLYLGAISLGFFTGSLEHTFMKRSLAVMATTMIYIFYVHFARVKGIFIHGSLNRYIWFIPCFIIGGILLLYKAPIKKRMDIAE